ncbi:MAG: phosphoglycerate dehydrogenase [Chloroflexi bacterium]|nr:phosphoglycerate dehydrogenase [Chloroflexota bacterium]
MSEPHPRVLVTARSFRKIPGPHHDFLAQAGLEVVESTVDRPLSEAELVVLIRGVDAAIIGVDPVTAEVIAAAPRLRVISRHGVGYDNVDVEAATRAGVVVTIAAGANVTAVAELTIGMMVALARHIAPLNTSTRSGGWSRALGLELAGKTLGIVGFGRIGQAVAQRARAFDMEVIAHDIARDESTASALGARYVELGELLSLAHFVTLHCSHGSGEPPLLGRAELALMPPNTYLINVARGGLVDEGALYEALYNRRLAGAAIDTFTDEPPRGNPLLTLDTVIATPHIGGYTAEATLATGLIAAQNVVDALAGRRPAGLLNPEVFVNS